MRSTTLNRGLIAAAAVTVSVALVGCSSSDASDSPSSTAPTTAAAPDTAAAAETVVDIAAANPDFSTLVSAVKAADLATTLSGSGPFTVFAPTDEAFAQVPDATLENLLKPENKDTLAGILTYHVVPGRVMASDVEAGKVKTVNGAEFTVAVADGAVTITDGQGNTANVVKTDINGSNGVIHVIDRVLLPPQ